MTTREPEANEYGMQLGRTYFAPRPNEKGAITFHAETLKDGEFLSPEATKEGREAIHSALTKKDNVSTPELVASLYAIRVSEIHNQTGANEAEAQKIADREIEIVNELVTNNEAFRTATQAAYEKMQADAAEKVASKKIPALTKTNGEVASLAEFQVDVAYLMLQDLSHNASQVNTRTRFTAVAALQPEQDAETRADAFNELLTTAAEEASKATPLEKADDYNPNIDQDHTTAFTVLSAAMARAYSRHAFAHNAGVSWNILLKKEVLDKFLEKTPEDDGNDAGEPGPQPGDEPGRTPEQPATDTPEAESTEQKKPFMESLIDGLRANHRGIITAAAILTAAGGAAYEIGRRRGQNPDNNAVVTRLMQAGAFAGVGLAGGLIARNIARNLDNASDTTEANETRSTLAYGLGAAAVFYVAQALYRNQRRAARNAANGEPAAGEGEPINPDAPNTVNTGIAALDRFINAIRANDRAIAERKLQRDFNLELQGAENASKARIEAVLSVVAKTNEVDEQISIVRTLSSSIKSFMGKTLKIEGKPLELVGTMIDLVLSVGQANERIENKGADILGVLKVLDDMSVAQTGAERIQSIVKEIGTWLFVDPKKQLEEQAAHNARIQEMIKEFEEANLYPEQQAMNRDGSGTPAPEPVAAT